MTNKLDTLPARTMQLLVVAFSDSASEGERLQALLGVDRHLKSVGSDGHDLVDRIKLSDKDNLKQVFDAGRAKGREEEIEQRQRSDVAIASLAGNGYAATGFGGFTSREIVGHMLLNKQQIKNGWEARFVVTPPDSYRTRATSCRQSKCRLCAASFKTGSTENSRSTHTP